MPNRPVALLAAQLSSLRRERAGALIVVMASEHEAEALARLLAEMTPDATTRFFPAWDCLPYDRASPSADIMGRRMRVLRDLGKASDGMVVVTTPEAALQRVPAAEAVDVGLVLAPGEALDPAVLERTLLRFGYAHADQVDEAGRFAIRGEVADLFPAGPRPYRIALESGRIAAIHRYDPASQRSARAEVAHLRVGPVTEIVEPEDGDGFERFAGMEHWLPQVLPALATLFEALPDADVIAEPQVKGRADTLLAQVEEAYRERVEVDARGGAEAPRKALPPERLYLTRDEWQDVLAAAVDVPDAGQAAGVPHFAHRTKAAAAKAFKAELAKAREAGLRIVLSAGKARVLAELGERAERALGEPPRPVERWDDVAAAEPGALLSLALSAEAGFVDGAAGVMLITASDLLGSRAERPGPAAHAIRGADEQVAVGDAVVHLDHGLAVLKGLETTDDGAVSGRDTVRLGFAKSADLLVPVEDLHRVWRYGAAEDGLTLDRLDGDGWEKRRVAVMAEIDDTAQALVALAAARDGTEAPRLEPPAHEVERFAARFPFQPTPDQARAAADVADDLASGRPMNRLVVGDVGYGKTEVALRAAAAAVLAGRQVAVVAPTTVLVRQHVETFRKRFEPFGIDVAHLSRLVPAAEAERVKAGLADGTVRLVVGTHALAGVGVEFRDLGLLVVDEEQRFGTAHKAKLSEMGAGLHVLTLTATPIPRTLQSALVGLQDLSVIATPPARRRPIRTLVTAFDKATIHTALSHEKARGGQSFVVVPRIEDLEPLAADLAEAMPELAFAVAHGRMAAGEVEDAMVGFADGRGDVLLATSLIESGLDVPRANTMVVVDADRFGLAQLHQLRGRVGRGGRQGVCYLMTDPARPLPEATTARLGTLAVLDRLGSGLAISARDLDLRGAGDLVGDDQAGHLRLIGLGLYQHLLQLAIRRARGEDVEDWTPEIHVSGPTGRLPEDYIPEMEVRLSLYARLARIADVHEADLLAAEIEDRFGPLPEAATDLVALARLRSLCHDVGVARLDAGPKAVALTFRPGIVPDEVMERAAAKDRTALTVSHGRLVHANPAGTARDGVAHAARLLATLAPL